MMLSNWTCLILIFQEILQKIGEYLIVKLIYEINHFLNGHLFDSDLITHIVSLSTILKEELANTDILLTSSILQGC